MAEPAETPLPVPGAEPPAVAPTEAEETHAAFVPPVETPAPTEAGAIPPVDPAAPPVEPEEYNYDEVKFHETAGMSEEAQTAAKDFFKTEQVSPELAQKMLDYSNTVGQEQMAAHQHAVTTYKQEAESALRKDLDYGGKNFSATYAEADTYLKNHSGDPELRELLIKDGWIHPKLVKHFAGLQRTYHNEEKKQDKGAAPTNSGVHPAYVKYPEIARAQGHIK